MYKIIKEGVLLMGIVILAIYGYQNIYRIPTTQYTNSKDSILAELKLDDSVINSVKPNSENSTQKMAYFMNKRILDRMKLDSLNSHK